MQNRQEFLLDQGTCFFLLWFFIMQMKRVNTIHLEWELSEKETVLAQVAAASRKYHQVNQVRICKHYSVQPPASNESLACVLEG